jgi:hypothetical protein
MKHLFYILTLLLFSNLYSQKVLVQTVYKSIPPQEFSEEKNEFIFDVQGGTLTKKNSQNNVESKYFIQLAKEYYDENKDFYFVEYKTDFKKNAENAVAKSEVGIFTIMYNEKEGTVLTVILNFLEAESAALYLTEKGEESPKVKALFN